MKPSPLQLSQIHYPVLEFRANPDATEEQIESSLQIVLESRVRYEADGDHFAGLTITAGDEKAAYALKIEAFTMFRIDMHGCKEAYKQSFNPLTIAVNVARLLFSSCREFVATITSRAPYGAAALPSVVIEPSDIALTFEDGNRDQILSDFFGFSEEQLDQLREAIRVRTADKTKKRAARKSRSKRPSETAP